MGGKRITRGHVYYFEPNDTSIGKDQNGDDIPLMPHFEDMCISMSLTAEIYRRSDKNCLYTVEERGNVHKIERTISWISYNGQSNNDASKLAQQVVNDGEVFGGEKYLTTYYTEISADQYIENELIEGLGVTSVSLSFESWYTPTITINFVDVHGSALFGREEAIHDNGTITSDNILGVFFTQPYPLFRLQIKGFLGQSVTYQLTVSSFKGKYNAQTGNFEITATFIGYSYSLLTDIPLTLLSSVSEMSYVGKQYWDAHVNTPEWALKRSDGSFVAPTPLYILIENIRSAIGSIDTKEDIACDSTPTGTKTIDDGSKVKSAVEKDQTVSLEAAKVVSDATKTNTLLNGVRDGLNNFYDACHYFCRNGFMFTGSENGEEQILLVPGEKGDAKTKEIKTGDDFREKYVSFANAIEEFNKANPNEKIKNEISEKNPYDFHKKITSAAKGAATLKCDKIFYVSDNPNTGKDSAVVFVENVDKSKRLKSVEVKDLKISGQSLYPSTAEALKKKLDDFNNPEKNADFKNCNGFGSYGFILPLGNIISDLEGRFQKLSDASNSARIEAENEEAEQSNSTVRLTYDEKKAEQERKRIKKEKLLERKILEIVGFEPTVGNFVKLLMCHLETFVEVMFRCAEKINSEIDNGNRLPSQMGFMDGLKSTDIPDSNASARGVGTQDDFTKAIYGWPTLYRPQNETNSETSSMTQQNVLGIPLDYTPKKGHSWEEMKVLTSCIDAIARCEERLNKQSTKKSFKYINSIPMSGLDLGNLDSPFRFVSRECYTIENLASYLGIRIAQVVGVSDSKCSSDIAEAIGSVDAINLILSYPSPEDLYKSIQSKDGSMNFSQRVIDYITCNNRVKGTTETEDGKSFNLFETHNSKNFYNKSRHPIFVDMDGSYGYSYTYAPIDDSKHFASIIPTDLFSFKGLKNPYSEIFDYKLLKNEEGEDGVYIPKCNKNGDQHWVHTIHSDKLSNSVGLGSDYKNERMFTILPTKIIASTIETQINSLKEGQIKISNYTIKGASEDEKIKRFLERRYKMSAKDYQKFYFGSKNYRIIGPSIITTDEKYASEHLCLENKDKDKDSITFDNQWLKADSDLGKKIALQKNEDEFSFKCGDKTLKTDELYVYDLPFKRNGNVIGSLFGSKIFYAQNDEVEGYEGGQLEFRRLSKLYLIVSSMMSGIEEPEKDLFKSDETSIIKKFPRFYILFIGGLLWRKSLKDGVDINHAGYGENFPDKDTSLISKTDKIPSLDENKVCDWYTISDYYMPYKNIDPIVKNRLIDFFKEYSKTAEYAMILKQCELGINNENLINSKIWDELCPLWSKSDFNPKKPDDWSQIFGDIFDRISSISLSSDNKSFNILFNEKYQSLGHLENLYGLDDFAIVSRSTTRRIGNDGPSVNLSKSQIMGYLKGFEERIKEFKNECDKIDKEESASASITYDRDIMVTMYYNIQHVWNSWLMTASRDQFTIKNFFNKYFVFIDSFYMNVYNEIKLNVQHISDAYNTKDISLLTFMQSVTSNAGMMLFALPDFVDNNIYSDTSVKSYISKRGQNNFEWSRGNLDNLFTPIPYNEQNPPKVNNVFVFVYTHKFSDNALENTDKKFDSYMLNGDDIWPDALTKGIFETDGDKIIDNNDETVIAKPNNTLLNSEEELVSGRYGYWMPCFGVTVNRGNNYIFKSINVNMDSPKVTSVSAQTWENILTKTGSDSSKRIFFRGQDIYSIYSQYAYSCEIEMLGCAQIQPLMYFQLLNIPMWRGTYMIYKVQHNMGPGTMTTKFTGMKMSRYQTPYATGYFTLSKESVTKPTEVQNITTSEPTSTTPITNEEPEVIPTVNGKYAVGGKKMVQAIFGEYTGYRIGSGFGEPRRNDDGVVNHWHAGVDIMAPEGTPLHAPWDGKVKYVNLSLTKSNGKLQTAGKYICFLDSSGKNMVIYMHCTEICAKKDDVVKAGTVIAKLGHTGGSASTGRAVNVNHLHLELYKNGALNWAGEIRPHGTRDAVDPMQEYGYIDG